MYKRNLLNLVLLLAVVGLGLLAWLEPGREPVPQPIKITALDPAAIERIRIERPADVVEMVRTNERWRLTLPLAALANSIRTDAIVSIAAIESLGHQPINNLDLAAYGLVEPKARLSLNDITIDFGGTTPLDNRRYVRVGDTLHLIPDLRYYQLIGHWSGYVSLRLLEEGIQLERIELPQLTLINAEGSWLPQPAPVEWSADAATALAQAWHTAQALEVRTQTEEVQGEEVRLQVRGREQPIRFVIAAREPELVLHRPDLGLAWHLAPGSADNLLELHMVADTAENGG